MRSLILLACALSLLVPLHQAVLVAQEPGTILAQEPMASAPAGVTAWRIRYLTGGRDGVARQEATAVIMAPADTTDRAPRGVVAWTHGTWGVASKCAPSQGPRFFEVTPAVSAVAMGYVVVAPDYPGLGTDATHPLPDRATNRTIRDRRGSCCARHASRQRWPPLCGVGRESGRARRAVDGDDRFSRTRA